MALPKKHRLTKKEITLVKKGARRFFCPAGIILLKKNNLSFDRFSFSVSAKAAKKSFLRNKVRRMASEWVRLNLEKNGGFDVVVFFNKESVSGTKKEFYDNLKDSFVIVKLL